MSPVEQPKDQPTGAELAAQAMAKAFDNTDNKPEQLQLSEREAFQKINQIALKHQALIDDLDYFSQAQDGVENAKFEISQMIKRDPNSFKKLADRDIAVLEWPRPMWAGIKDRYIWNVQIKEVNGNLTVTSRMREVKRIGG